MQSREVCPLLENPLPQCYCLKLTSLDVSMAVQYCLNKYKDCRIFQYNLTHKDSKGFDRDNGR